MFEQDFDDACELGSAETDAPLIDSYNQPVIAVVNAVAVALMEILGPACWAALIVLFLVAEVSSG